MRPRNPQKQKILSINLIDALHTFASDQMSGREYEEKKGLSCNLHRIFGLNSIGCRGVNNRIISSLIFFLTCLAEASNVQVAHVGGNVYGYGNDEPN